MHYVTVFTALVAAVSLTSAQEQDECMPKFTPGQRHMHIHHGECCNLGDFIPKGIKSAMDTCRQKMPRPPKPSGPPPAGAAGPPPEIKKHMTCMGECLFTEAGLLTADKQLNADAINKVFVSDDSNLGPVLKSAVTKCLSSYKDGVDQSLECKSGSEEFHLCMSREVFLNCPAAQWTESTECTELKAKTTKCPKMPVHLGKKPPHGPPN